MLEELPIGVYRRFGINEVRIGAHARRLPVTLLDDAGQLHRRQRLPLLADETPLGRDFFRIEPARVEAGQGK